MSTRVPDRGNVVQFPGRRPSATATDLPADPAVRFLEAVKDPRLMEMCRRWLDLPEHVREAMYLLAIGRVR